MEITSDLRKRLTSAQRNEITEHHIYKRITATLADVGNREVLEQIAEDELRHYKEWEKYTGQDVNPSWLKVWFYSVISRILGFTFSVKLMEQGEESAQDNYAEIAQFIPEITQIHADETLHEEKLLSMLDEECLWYAGSVVLGLNDALVELTGALAGLTLALQNVNLITLSGLITGIAASLSMAASEYLSTSSEVLHFGGKRGEFPQAVFRNGRFKPECGSNQLHYRLPHPYMVGCRYLIFSQHDVLRSISST